MDTCRCLLTSRNGETTGTAWVTRTPGGRGDRQTRAELDDQPHVQWGPGHVISRCGDEGTLALFQLSLAGPEGHQ